MPTRVTRQGKYIMIALCVRCNTRIPSILGLGGVSMAMFGNALSM